MSISLNIAKKNFVPGQKKILVVPPVKRNGRYNEEVWHG
jgi:hypothetical protein